MLLITVIINIFSSKIPGIVEKYYSNGFNRLIRQFLSRISEIFSFSLAELFVIAALIYAVFNIARFIISLKNSRNKKSLIFNFIARTLCIISVIYFLFISLWGINYNRLSFAETASLEVKGTSSKELSDLCEHLIYRANTLRQNLKEDSKGVMYIPGGYKDVFNREPNAYDTASQKYSVLKGSYGNPKPVFLSKLMCYTGITGVYFPFTGEANVNISINDFMLPCTAAHEMAHQRGFAREDEANYIAYVACTLSNYTDFQYSGVMLGLIYSMDALRKVDYNQYKLLTKEYSPKVIRDLKNDSQFWSRYDGVIENVSDTINNNYLKSNGQQDGVQSYGRMVDLLIAEYKEKKLK
jgi:hypothetical protein